MFSPSKKTDQSLKSECSRSSACLQFWHLCRQIQVRPIIKITIINRVNVLTLWNFLMICPLSRNKSLVLWVTSYLHWQCCCRVDRTRTCDLCIVPMNRIELFVWDHFIINFSINRNTHFNLSFVTVSKCSILTGLNYYPIAPPNLYFYIQYIHWTLGPCGMFFRSIFPSNCQLESV